MPIIIMTESLVPEKYKKLQIYTVLQHAWMLYHQQKWVGVNMVWVGVNMV